MRTRVFVALATIVALVTGSALLQAPTKASALSPGVSFSADDQSTWQTNGVVYALGTSGGKVIAGGTFSQLRPPTGGSGTVRSQNALAIFNAETGAPDSCQFAITGGGTPSVRGITTNADQSIVYIAGNFSNVGGVNVSRVAALDVQNCTVAPFRPATLSSTATALAHYGNVLYVGGLFNTVGGQTRRGFAALDATTGALLDWTANAVRTRTDLPVEVTTARAVAVSPDGQKVVVGGDMDQINGEFSHSIAIVTGANGANGAGGSIIRTYPEGFIPASSVTKHITSGDDGRFYISNEGTGGGVFDGRAAFSWETGEQIWRDTCLGATQATVLYQGTLYSASHAHDCSGINAFNDGIRRYFMAQDSTTAELKGWFPLGNDGTGEGIGPRALVIATGATTGKKFLWSGGEFTQINGRAQQGLTRFGPDDTGNPPTVVANAEATTDGKIQVRFRTVVDPDDSDLTYSVYRNNSSTPIWTGTAKSLWWERPQVTFVDSNVTVGTNYSYRVTASDGTNTSALSATTSARAIAAASDYDAAIRASNPVSYWSGSTNGTWGIDESASSSRTDGVPVQLMDGAVASSESAVTTNNGSFSFDGVNDYLVTDQLRPGPSTYTIGTWIKTTTTSGGKIIGFGNGRPRTGNLTHNLSGNYDRQIYMLNDGRVRFGVWTGNATTLTSSAALNDGAWHFIVASQGASGMSLYIDGKRVGSNSNANSQDYWGVWRVGGDNLSGWPDQPASNFFNGQIDDIAIYGSALGARDVATQYTAAGGLIDTNPAPADAYGAAVYDTDPQLFWRLGDTGATAVDSTFFGSTPGTLNSGVTTGTTGVVAGNTAVTFPGNNSGTIATSQRVAPSSTMTAEVWFNTTTTQGGKIIGFENQPTGEGANYDKHLYMANDGRLIWGSYIGWTAVVESAASYNDGQWHQAVAQLDQNGRRLYVDGVLVAENNVVGSENGEGYWRLGGGNIGGWPSQPSSYYFAGSLDEFSIYSSTLSAATIAQHYALGIADATAPTVPTALTASQQADGVHLGWTASTDNVAVSAYNVYRGTTLDFTVDPASLVGTATTTSFVDASATPGAYYYRVVAADAAGNQSAASASLAVNVVDNQAPTAPTDAAAQLAGNGVVSVTWTASTDNVGVVVYDVHRGTANGFVPSAATKIGESTGTVFLQEAVTPGDYVYKVVARDAAGNAGAASSAASITVPAPDLTAPTQPGSLNATANGIDIALSWTASTDNVGVTGYQVHRAAAAGFEPSASTLLGITTGTEFADLGRPIGTSYYKVVAVDAAGNASTAAEASATVADTVAPSAPGGVTPTVSGANVSLSWTASTDNVGVTGYQVHRGTTTGFAVSAATQIGTAAGTSFSDTGRPSGTWYYKVVAVDAAGNASSASASASAVVDTEGPSTPAGLATSVSGANVSLSWTASTDNVGVTGYQVHRGTTTGFAASAATQIGTAAGTSFSDTGRPSGTWYYKVVAVDAAGNASSASASTSAVIAAAPAEPVTVTVPVLADAMAAQIAPTTLYGATNQLSSRGNTPIISFLSFELPAAPAGTVLTGAELRVRTSTDATAGSTDTHTINLSGGAWDEATVTWNNRPTTVGPLVGTLGAAPAINTPYVATLTPSELSSVLGSTQTLRLSSTGADNVRLWSKEAANATYRPVLVLQFTPTGGSDTVAPSVPAGASAAVSGSDVTVSWSASTDNVGVTGYQVHRGTTTGFAVSAATQIGTATATTFADAGRPAGTWYYRIVAVDAAGNASAASDTAVGVIAPPAAGTVMVEVPVLADSMAAQIAPTTLYGTLNQLSARGNTPIESFLSFALPAAPAGTVLTGAELRVRTSTDATAGSTDTHTIDFVTGDWTEAAITWNNRPTTGGALLGALGAAPATNTAYVAPLTASVLAPTLGSTQTLRLSSAGTDNVRLWSKEAANATYRPVLVLQFSPVGG